MNKLFIFDFDGTIADTKDITMRGLIDYSRNNSLPIPNLNLICNNYANCDNYDFGWNVDKEKQRYLMDKAFIFTTECIASGLYLPKIFDEAFKIIKNLYDRGHILAICTSREKIACEKILEYYNLQKYFKVLKTRDDVTLRNKKAKPNPDLILEIIDELKFSKDKTFIIGDTEGDILGGKNANINTIAVTWGYCKKNNLKRLKPDYLISKFEDIFRIL